MIEVVSWGSLGLRLRWTEWKTGIEVTHSDVTQVSTPSIATSFSLSCSLAAAALSPRRALSAGVTARSRSRMTILQRSLW